MGVLNLTDTNPYSPPSTTVEAATVTSSSRSSLRGVRVLFYIHVAVVCWFAAFTLSDTGQIKVPDFVKAMFYFRLAQVPLVCTWMVCRVLMTIAAWRIPERTTAFRVSIVVGDVMLSLFQLWVMLPLVQ